MNKKTQEEIKKLVDKSGLSGAEANLFKAQLEYIAAVAEKEQMEKDHQDTLKILRSKTQ